MDGGIHADTRRIRRHSDFLREERRTARTLRDALRRAMFYAEPQDTVLCHRLSALTDELEEYFGTMADFVEDFAEDLERASRNASDLLEENRRMVQGISDRIHAADDFEL